MSEEKSQHAPFVLHTRVVTGTGGGPEKTILNSPRFLRRHGIDCACLFMRSPDDGKFRILEAKAKAAAAEVIGIDDCGPFDLNVIRESIRVCRERRVDIWHAHDYKSNALGLLVRMFHPMHLVTTAHGWVQITKRTPTYYRIDRFCMKRYDQVVAVSRDLYDVCRSIGLSDERLTLVDNAIIVEDYDPSPPSPADRARFGFGNDRVLLGAAGRLSEEKGFHHLIEAVARLIECGQPIGLVIAGEGHLRESLQQQIRDRGLSEHVILAGFLKDPRELYRAIDVFVLSSLREGLPNVLLESMASQRAVVTTRVNGIPRLVTDGENGYVVEPDSVDELCGGIHRCLNSTEQRRQIAAAGRFTIENRFCFARRMEKIVDTYRRLSPQLEQYIDRVRHASQSSHQIFASASATSG
ncbi:MAG: glycosyltransferase family 4 protein [Planctomycetaceae bacterium]|nr:glycosyltransferase family 4 protein [Planctomycetaceae bacterium]